MYLCLKASPYYQWISSAYAKQKLRANHIVGLSLLVLGGSKELYEIILLIFQTNLEACVLHKVVVIFYPFENLVGKYVYVLFALKVGRHSCQAL